MMETRENKKMSIDLKTARQLETFTPEEMLKYCEHRIQGQGKELKKAVYMIYQYLQCVAKGETFNADNWFLTGISGSGKTEFFRVIRDFFKLYDIPIPVVQIDLSNITETGFKGAEPTSIPKRIIEENPNTKGVGICFLDEADKKCIASYSSNNVNVNAAVQANLLTMIEGKKFVDDDMPDFDSGLTMFVFIGAFQELRNRKKKIIKNNGSIGFETNFDKAVKNEISSYFQDELTLQEMIEFGLMEELAGRMVQVINFHRLSEKDMLTLIKCKVKEIAKAMDVNIEITKQAANEFLSISFGDLGVRCPMNKIRELTQNKISEVFFENGFNPATNKVVIDSLHSARIKRIYTNRNAICKNNERTDFNEEDNIFCKE